MMSIIGLLRTGKHLLTAALCIACVLPVACFSAQHQYPWTTFISLQDTQQNGVQYRFRKGDNDGRERTMVFHGYYNRYKVKILIDFECELVNINTGKSIKLMKNVELPPESESDYAGNWDTAPDAPLDANGWNAVRFEIRNFRVTKLRMALAAEPLGALYEVFPTNEILAKQRAGAIAAEKKRQDEERERQRLRAEALRKQQEELQQQQRQAQQQYEAQKQQQAAVAEQRRLQLQAEAKRRQDEWQRAEQARREKIIRDCQARIDRVQAINTAIQQIADYIIRMNEIKSERKQQEREIDDLDLTDDIEGVTGAIARVKAAMKKEAGLRADLALAELHAVNYQLQAENDERIKAQNPYYVPFGNARLSQQQAEREARDVRGKLHGVRNEIEQRMGDLERAKEKVLAKEADEERKAQEAEVEQARLAALAQEQARIDKVNAVMAALVAEQQRQAEAQRLADKQAEWNLFQIEHPEEAAKIIREREEAAKRAREEAERIEAARREAERKVAAEQAEKERLAAEARAKAAAERRAAERRAVQQRIIQDAQFELRSLIKAHSEAMLAFTIPATATAQEQQYHALGKQGATALLQHDDAAALTAFTKCHDLLPARDAYEPARALALIATGSLDDAVAILCTLRVSPRPDTARQARDLLTKLTLLGTRDIPASPGEQWYTTGSAALAQGNLAEAEKAYRHAIQVEPCDPRWQQSLAGLLGKQARWADAAEIYRTMLQQDPTDAKAAANLGAALLQQQHWSEAVDAYRTAVRLEASSAVYQDQLGTALWYADKLKEAITAYQEAVRLDPTNTTYQEHVKQAQDELQKK